MLIYFVLEGGDRSRVSTDTDLEREEALLDELLDSRGGDSGFRYSQIASHQLKFNSGNIISSLLSINYL